MKFTVTKAALQSAFGQAASTTPRRSTLPILSHVLIEAGDGLTVSATGLDRAVVVRVRADIAGPGRIATPAKTLDDLAKTLGDAPVHMERDGERLVVRSGRTVARLPLSDADDFPALPTVDMAGAVEIGAAELTDLIAQSAFAVSTEESRPILNGVLVENRDGRLRHVATNGHRLAAVYGPDAPDEWAPVIVPIGGMDLIARTVRGMAGPVKIGVGKNHLRLDTEGATVYSRLIKGPYPNYEQVIPKEFATDATVDRAALLAVIRRALVVASSQTGWVRMAWDAGSVQVSTTTPDTGDMSEALECSVEGSPIEIGFNGTYLVEILSRIATDEVVIRMSAPERAAVIVPAGDPDALYLCMPLRLLD